MMHNLHYELNKLVKVCLVLLLANSMRIFFRYGEVYEDALLLQSLIMIIAMIVLTELCVRTNRFKSTKQHRIVVFTLYFDVHIFGVVRDPIGGSTLDCEHWSWVVTH